MHHQLWRYKVEEKLHMGIHEQKNVDTTAVHYVNVCVQHTGIHKHVHNTCSIWVLTAHAPTHGMCISTIAYALSLFFVIEME
jgi:hypothetical protein